MSVLAALAAAGAFYRSNRQIDRLAAAAAELGRLRTFDRTATDEMDAALHDLEAYLAAVQHPSAVPASYDEWSNRQRQAHASIASLRQRSVELEPAAPFPIATAPELPELLDQLRQHAATLARRWFEYDQQGSGLTPKSSAFAADTLLPLVGDDLGPVLPRLESALQNDVDTKAAAIPAFAESARRMRLIAGAGLLPLLGLIVFAVISARRQAAPQSGAPAAAPVRRVREENKKHTPVLIDYAASAAALGRGRLRILIGGHSAADGELLSLLLTGAGYATIVCTDGANARAAIQTIRFDLLLLERQLPGASRAELLAEARRGNAEQQVILLAAPDEEPDAAETAERGVRGTLRLPADPRTLLEKVAEVLGPAKTEMEVAPTPSVSAEPGIPAVIEPSVPAEAEPSLPVDTGANVPAETSPPVPPPEPFAPATDPTAPAAPPRKRLVRRKLASPDEPNPPG